MTGIQIAALVLFALLILLLWVTSPRKKELPQDKSAEEMIEEINAAHAEFIRAVQLLEREGYTISPGEGFDYTIIKKLYDSKTQAEGKNGVL